MITWAMSGVKAKTTAFRLALELAQQDAGTIVESREKLAALLGVHQSTAQRARLALLGAGIVYKSGRHLYVSDKAAELRAVQP